MVCNIEDRTEMLFGLLRKRKYAKTNDTLEPFPLLANNVPDHDFTGERDFAEMKNDPIPEYVPMDPEIFGTERGKNGTAASVLVSNLVMALPLLLIE